VPFHRLLLFLSLGLALAVCAPRAHAGMYICKSAYTDSDDRQQLHAAMQRVFPLGVQLEGIPDICRNKRSARAWLDTWAHPRPDGVTEWWTVRCERESRNWICDPPVHNQLIWVYANVGGIVRRLEVTFDDATRLAQARRVAVQAIQIVQDSSSAPLPACRDRSSAEAQRQWEKIRREHSLAAADTVVELSVMAEEAGGVRVSLSGATQLGLTFTDNGDEPTTGNGACWTEWIVIG